MLNSVLLISAEIEIVAALVVSAVKQVLNPVAWMPLRLLTELP